MMKILVSACLLGENVRYDGGHNLCHHDIFNASDVISCCPEMLGGLPVPRLPAELYHDRVINREGKDVSRAFKKGADETLSLVHEHNIKVAIMKANSPSCSNTNIYDGTHTKTLKKGKGITVTLLEKEGVRVFNEHELDDAYAYVLAQAQV